MIELVKTANALELRPDDLETLADARDLDEALESNLCNGWRRVQPEECGAMTDGFLITDDWEDDDHGTLTHLGTVYWDANYMVTDTLDELREGKTVRWTASEKAGGNDEDSERDD